MRFAALTLIGSVTLAAAALPANAAPTLARADAPLASNVIEVSGGCGPAAHRDYYGYCRANYYYRGGYGWYGHPHYYWHRW
jgi:hypothetical protein